MARTPRDQFDGEVAKLDGVGGAAGDALASFADAIDPNSRYERLPKPRPDGGVEHASMTNSSAALYLQKLRVAVGRGLDLLGADADAINRFMDEITTPPDERSHDVVDYDGALGDAAAQSYQSALRAFFRWADEPGESEGRPDAAVAWPADAIHIYRDESAPAHDEEDMPEQADLDALREACVRSQNTRRDRAFLEVAAGTAQRVYALVTLLVGDVVLDDEVPHVLLNPDIRNDGDKGAIDKTGRFKPIVTDPAPIQDWIDHHPLADPDRRAAVGAPEEFDDCYLFVGDPGHARTDMTDHWGRRGAGRMLERRKADTAELASVPTVEVPVNPHNWRHYAYTQSQDLPIDESTRRKVFGWSPGSKTGQQIYGHKANEKAAREFAEAWWEQFDVDEDGVDSDALLDRAAAEGTEQMLVDKDELQRMIERQIVLALEDEELDVGGVAD